ncbi:uncharacterized protein LOC127240886 [Andrographis paniculata]|uniref:uncharacterized protein LOC127240886 n=1 Tax=Andrographis paniculata TaxID=175694 RepID=UPI0021E89FA7|nr:uncharacterized protein LOC127240886 [Andrographis paniculata]
MVDQINNIVLPILPGNTLTSIAHDMTKDLSQQPHYEDYLSTLTPNGMPPHSLHLKKKERPLCYYETSTHQMVYQMETRLICKTISRNILEAKIIIGPCSGQTCLIPRIPLEPKNVKPAGIDFTRTQFLIKLCFAMTINKSQGQTLDRVGVYLPDPVFMHGMLYVAFSRAKSFRSLHIVVQSLVLSGTVVEWTKNITYSELLCLAGISL